MTGRTLQDLIAENRFTEVTRLLRQTTMPLKVIADTCGFRNLSHFMTAFRRRFGKTPSGYRLLYSRQTASANVSTAASPSWMTMPPHGSPMRFQNPPKIAFDAASGMTRNVSPRT